MSLSRSPTPARSMSSKASLYLGGNGSTVSTGSFTGAAGTDLELDGQDSDGSFGGLLRRLGGADRLHGRGSYQRRGRHLRPDASFTGTVVSLGSSLDVDAAR